MTTTSQASRYQQLRDHLNYLRLADAAAALPTVLDEAKAENLSATSTLERLFRIEVQATEARRLTGRLRFANLPSPATLEEFDYDSQPGVDPDLIRDLASGRYLDSATNILLIEPPGVGKTMLAVGLARKAAEAGHRTYFTNAADLAARCHRAAIEGRWATTMRFYAGPACLVIDELGYLPLPGEAASALFQVVNQRYLKSSIIMTTNRSITNGARCWATTPSLQHFWTGCCTARSSSTSPGNRIGCEITKPGSPTSDAQSGHPHHDRNRQLRPGRTRRNPAVPHRLARWRPQQSALLARRPSRRHHLQHRPPTGRPRPVHKPAPVACNTQAETGRNHQLSRYDQHATRWGILLSTTGEFR